MDTDRNTERIYRRRWLTLAVLGLSLLVIGLDNTILNVALPSLQREFQASSSALQWMVDSYVLVFAGLLLTMGAVGDRFGRARALAVGLVMFGGASAAAAFSSSEEQLIAARAVMGVGAALIMPATLSIITDIFPREERGRAIAIWAAVAGLGIGVGPMLGGALIEVFWWGSVFLVNVPVVIVALIAGFFLVPNSRDPEGRRLDLVGAALSMGAVSALVFGIIEAPSRGWFDVLVVGSFVAAVVFSVAFVIWERRTTAPMLPLGFFASRRFTLGAVAIGISFFALFGVIFAYTQYLQFVLGYSALDAGMRTAPMALGMALGAGMSHRVVSRLGTTRTVAGAMFGLAAALVGMSWWDTATAIVFVAGGLAAAAFFMGNIMAPSTDAVMGAVPAAKAGVGSAMNDVSRMVGGALGVAVLGSAINSAYSSQMAAAISALPARAAAAAQDSIGAATQVASSLPSPAGEALSRAGGEAFVDAMGLALFIGALVVAAGAILVARFLPATHGTEEPSLTKRELIERASVGVLKPALSAEAAVCAES
ncbi:MAG: DHA2 family efflux MFS transporter permease subunit [Thermoleophilia bacterium]